MFAENGGNQEWRGAVCVCVWGGGYILQWRGWKIFKVSLAFPS